MNYFISVVFLVFPIILTATITAFVTDIFANRRDRKKEDREFKNNRKKLATALSSEIKAFKTIYDNATYRLKKDPPQNGGDIKIVRLECNYVVTFDNNTDRLGLLDRKDIPKIISFYMELKSLIDTLMVLATKWENYNEFCNSFKTRIRNEILKIPLDYRKQNYKVGGEICIDNIFARATLRQDVADIHEFAYDIQEEVLKDADNIIQLLEKYNPDKENDTK